MNNQKQNKNKHLLFYSNLCTYSNEVHQKILKYNLKISESNYTCAGHNKLRRIN